MPESRYSSEVGEDEADKGAFGCPHDQFAIAKKFHAQNLRHQPLPDRVDDSLLKSKLCRKHPDWFYKSAKKPPTRLKGKHKNHLLTTYGPALGCKKPETHIDLAICWETPIDPDYEPRKPAHIDGSDGGPAPAIFSLVRRTVSASNLYAEMKVPREPPVEACGCKESEDQELEDGKEGRPCRCCCKDLCSTFKRISLGSKERYDKVNKHASTKTEGQGRNKSGNGVNPYQCSRKERHTKDRRNGLPQKLQIPRPRTPFARRSFCIDTLAPPFSIVDGCRDADYPEHWRLASIYQLSYRNPKKQLRSFNALTN